MASPLKILMKFVKSFFSAAQFGDLSPFGLLFGFKPVLKVATFWATFSRRLATFVSTFLAALSFFSLDPEPA